MEPSEILERLQKMSNGETFTFTLHEMTKATVHKANGMYLLFEVENGTDEMYINTYYDFHLHFLVAKVTQIIQFTVSTERSN